MTVKDLRNELKKRKQPVRAKRKEELIQQLLSVAHLPPSPVDDSPAMAAEENNQPDNCFHHEAKWHLLELDMSNPIQDPNNVPGLVALTTQAVGGRVEPEKYNFTDSFDREPFVALAKEYQLDRNGNVKKDRDQNPIMVDNVKKKGRPTLQFLTKNKLTTHSHRIEWLQARLPMSSDTPNGLSLDQWTAFTNMKAFLAQAGHNIYSGEFKPFNTTETK
jgi:hypothetical protein